MEMDVTMLLLIKFIDAEKVPRQKEQDVQK